MEIEKGFYVKCFLKNGFSIEGIVLEWNDDQIEIECSTDGSITIIHSPKEQLFLTKISLKGPVENNIEESIDNKDIKRSADIDLPQEEDEDCMPPKLYKEMGQVQYGYPGFFKNKGTE